MAKPRDPRVTRPFRSRFVLRRRPPGGQAHRDFAGVILGRHAAAYAVIAPVDRSPRQRAQAMPQARHTHWHAYRLGLRFDLRLTRQLRLREAARPFLAWPPPAIRPERPNAPPRTRDLIERIIAREHRVESIATIETLLERRIQARSGREARAAPALLNPAPPVPMVARRTSAAPTPVPAPAPSAAPPGHHVEADHWGAVPARLRTAAPALPIPLTPSELGRLTDHVVNAIDRRFVSYRERRGGR